MAGEFDPAIQKLVQEINDAEAKTAELKRMVNQLCGYAGRPPLYADTQANPAQALGALRPDQFYGQPLATATRMYLEMRQAAGQGAATVREIFEALKRGGFKFETKDEANAERGLRQSLTKNSVTFHKLPNGTYGLLEWYPNARPARPESKSADSNELSTDSATSSDASAVGQDDDASEP